MNINVARIMLAGTNSGCGKTTITCALLKALVNRGLKTGAFKCGPDYIDPMFHSRITGAKCANLDPFFFDDNTLKYLLAENSKAADGTANEINVIEGVMGFYDGLSFKEPKASSYDVARVTKSPVILVVGARGASLSVLAVIQGFLDFCPDNQIQGVILNQCTSMTYKVLAEAILERFDGRIRPLGFMPVMKDCGIESRHLGLVTAAEIEDLKEKLDKLAAQAEESIEIDEIIKLAKSADAISCEDIEIRKFEKNIRIAVARDKAFCFYYEDSLNALVKMGAELVDFSPMKDEALPHNIQGLYLGGGYPELYLNELSANVSMIESIKNVLKEGLPCIAECGGFMYLTESIADRNMVGFIKGNCYDTGKLSRFGYISLVADKDNMLCMEGESIKAHEFHHWDSSNPGEDFSAVKPNGRKWKAAFSGARFYGGYPHFHFYSNLKFAENFYMTCAGLRGEHYDREH